MSGWRTICGRMAAISSLLFSGCDNTPASRSSDNEQWPPKQPRILLVGSPTDFFDWDGVRSGAELAVSRQASFVLRSERPVDGSVAAFEEVLAGARDFKPHVLCVFVVGDPSISAALANLTGEIMIVTVGAGVGAAPALAHVQADPAAAAELLDAVGSGSLSYILLHARGRDEFGTHCYDRFMFKGRQHEALKLLRDRSTIEDPANPVGVLASLSEQFRAAGVAIVLDPHILAEDARDWPIDKRAKIATLSTSERFWPALRSGRVSGLAGFCGREVGSVAIETAMRVLIDRRASETIRAVEPRLVTCETLDAFVADCGRQRREK
jgi:hypothetical protein